MVIAIKIYGDCPRSILSRCKLTKFTSTQTRLNIKSPHK